MTATTVEEMNQTGIPSGKMGMWLFLVSEVMFFTGLLGAYIVLRAGYAWPNPLEVLNTQLATINTIVLLTSSLSIALAVIATEQKDMGKIRIFLGITILLGLAFLGVKGIEYADKFSHGHGPGSGLFYDCYFALTGMHGLHVIIGIIGNIWLLLLTFSDTFWERRAQLVEYSGLYWHFVDVVWIFLFPILYLM